ncbi:c-type cytochrome [Chitinimonas naiadis]
MGMSRKIRYLPLLASLAALPLWIAAAPAQDTLAQRVKACMACHGDQGRATSDGYYPRIAGKPAGYLYNQLLHFRDGRRSNPTMAYMVRNLPEAYLREIAQYFADQHPPYPAPQTNHLDQSTMKRGEQLVRSGDASKQIPACIACHGTALTGVQPAVPGLLGLPRDYLYAQFNNWKNGQRHATLPDCMGQIAQRLSQDDLVMISTWLAAQTVPANTMPADRPAGPLPLACGSMPQ